VEDGTSTSTHGKGVAGLMKRLWVKKRRKRQKRCYRKGRRKDRSHGYEEKAVKAGEEYELWEDEHPNRHHRYDSHEG
jgi:ribosomal protein L3